MALMFMYTRGGGARPTGSICRGRRTERVVLTWVFDGGNDELEAVILRTPGVRHVLEGHEICAREHSPHRLFGVSAGEVSL
jgi:hypothetical protein